MNIDEMQAGREMDALVAEKVMGEKEKWLCYDGVPVAPCLIDLDKYDPEECTYIEKHGTNKGCKEYKKSRDIKPYSTDLSAAWEVLMKLQSMGFTWMLGDALEDGKFAMEMSYAKVITKEFKAIEKTVPLLICKVALKAMEARP